MPAIFDRCVRKVRGKGVENPYAVCHAAMAKSHRSGRRSALRDGHRRRATTRY